MDVDRFVHSSHQDRGGAAAGGARQETPSKTGQRHGNMSNKGRVV